MKCLETDDEPESHNSESFYQLSCFIEKGLLLQNCFFECRLGSGLFVEDDVNSYFLCSFMASWGVV